MSHEAEFLHNPVVHGAEQESGAFAVETEAQTSSSRTKRANKFCSLGKFKTLQACLCGKEPFHRNRPLRLGAQ